MTARQSFRSILAALFLLTVPLVVHAETKILTAESTYTMGDGETPSFAEAMVLQKAKQMALEEAGTYVESYTRVQNLDLTTDEIQTLAGGVLQVEVLEKNRSLIGDGVRFYVKIKATVTTDKMEELAQRIKGKNVAEEYKKLQEDYAALTEEIESIKQHLGKSTPGPERDGSLARIQAKEQSFTELQRNETAFFQRLVSGSSLVQSARDEKTLIDDLVQAITRQKVEIGEITSKAILDGTNDVQIIVPLTVSIMDSDVDRLRTTVKALRGSLQGIAFSEIDANVAAVNFLSFRGERFRNFVRAIRISFDDEKIEDFLRERVQKAVLQVTFSVKDKSVLAACIVPASHVGLIFKAPLSAEDRLLPRDSQLAPSAMGYIPQEQYLDQSQEWQAWVKSEAAFGPLDEKYKEDFRGAGAGPLSSIKGFLAALFHGADLQAKINTMPSGPERMALETRLDKLVMRQHLLDKLYETYHREYGGEFHRLYGETSKSRYEEYEKKSILGDVNAKEALRREFPFLLSRDAVVIARDAGKIVLSVKAPTQFVRGLSQVTARLELGGASEVDSLQSLYKDKSPRQKEVLDEIIRRWSSLTSEGRTKLSKVFREKGILPLDAFVFSSRDVPMNADWHRGIFCSARSVAAE